MAKKLIWGPLFVLSICTGCDQISDVLPDSVKNKAQEVQESVQETVEDTASKAMESVKQVAQIAGSAEIMLNREVRAGRCYVTLNQPGENRPAILELKSYQTETDESFPTFLFHAEASSASWNDLLGQEVSGQLFIQTEADGPVWFTSPDQLVKVKLISHEGGNVEAELVSGALSSTGGQSVPAVSGKFHAVTP